MEHRLLPELEKWQKIADKKIYHAGRTLSNPCLKWARTMF